MKTSNVKKLLLITALTLSIAISGRAYTTISSDVTNYTFTSGTTYYISTNIELYGSCIMQGGAVIKFAPGAGFHLSYGQYLDVDHNGTVYITAMDDDTVGDTISGSTGSPSSYYYLALDGDVFLDNCNVNWCNWLMLYGTDYIYYCYFENLNNIYNGGTVTSYGNYVNGSPYSF